MFPSSVFGNGADTQTRKHHYVAKSAQRVGLEDGVRGLSNEFPLEVPIVVGGKEVGWLYRRFGSLLLLGVLEGANNPNPRW